MATIALSLGVGLATSLLSSLLTPPTEGPRLDDLNLPKSEWGQQIPIIYRRGRVNGNIIWTTNLKEHKKITKAKGRGGKGGGGLGKQTNYTYTTNIAVLLCQGPMAGIARIWVNRELQYDITQNTTTLSQSQSWANSYLREYKGTAAQGKNPIIEAYMGTAETPAYRHRTYFSVETYPAEGNMSFEAEVYSHGQLVGGKLILGTVTLAQVVGDIAARVGLTPAQYDVSDLAGVNVDGFFIQSPGSAKVPLNQLMTAYAFDAIETGDKIRFQLKTRPAINPIQVPFADIGSYEFGDNPPSPFSDDFTGGAGLPREVSLTFINPEINYEKDVARAFRQNAATSNSESLDFPISMTSAQAQKAVERYLYELWIARRTITLTLQPKYIFVEPGDILQVELYPSNSELLQVQTVTLGANYLIEIEAVPYSGSFPILSDSGSLGNSFVPKLPGPVVVRPLDIPFLSDTDANFRLPLAIRGENFSGADIYMARGVDSTDYQFVRRIIADTVQGVTINAMPNYVGNLDQVDTNSLLTVQLYDGELESISETRFDNGEFIALVGNEIVWVKNAVLTSTPMTYNLTYFKRGKRGTEKYCIGHVANERFVILSGFLDSIQLKSSDFGQVLKFKGVAANQNLDDVASSSFQYLAESARPYTPHQFAYQLYTDNGSANNVRFSWVRRDKRGDDGIAYIIEPMSETSELYLTRLYNSANDLMISRYSETPLLELTEADMTTAFGSRPWVFRSEIVQHGILALSHPLVNYLSI